MIAVCTKKILNNDIYIAYPKVMDSKYWWIVEVLIGLSGIVGVCLTSFR